MLFTLSFSIASVSSLNLARCETHHFFGFLLCFRMDLLSQWRFARISSRQTFTVTKNPVLRCCWPGCFRCRSTTGSLAIARCDRDVQLQRLSCFYPASCPKDIKEKHLWQFFQVLTPKNLPSLCSFHFFLCSLFVRPYFFKKTRFR